MWPASAAAWLSWQLSWQVVVARAGSSVLILRKCGAQLRIHEMQHAMSTSTRLLSAEAARRARRLSISQMVMTSDAKHSEPNDLENARLNPVVTGARTWPVSEVDASSAVAPIPTTLPLPAAAFL